MYPVQRKRGLLSHQALPVLTTALSACWAAAQTTRSADSQPPAELPREVLAALEGIEDFSFSFAQAGFHAVLEHLKTTSASPGHAREPVEIRDWTALLERPADFRGLPITIEGVVGRNTPWRFEREEYRRLGPVWQLELWRSDQPIAATLILTSDATDIPLGATIRVTGYFVMMRQYYSQTKRLRQAALLVAQGPTLVSQAIARTRTRSASSWILGLMAALTAALLVIWLLLRRSVGRTRLASQSLRASGPAPTSLAEDLAAWAGEEQERPGDEDTKPAGGSRETEEADGVSEADGP